MRPRVMQRRSQGPGERERGTMAKRGAMSRARSGEYQRPRRIRLEYAQFVCLLCRLLDAHVYHGEREDQSCDEEHPRRDKDVHVPRGRRPGPHVPARQCPSATHMHTASYGHEH